MSDNKKKDENNLEEKEFYNLDVYKRQPMSNDVLVEVEFEQKGTKKIMANFARLRKID